MKILFVEIEQWEEDYIKAALDSRPVAEQAPYGASLRGNDSKSGNDSKDVGLFFESRKLNKDTLDSRFRGNDTTLDSRFRGNDNKSGSDRNSERDFDAISVFVGSEIKKETLDALPNLKLITTRSTGFDHIDLTEVKKRGIKTGYVPGYGDNTVAEFAYALILNLSRKIFEAYRRIKEEGRFNFNGLQGFDLNGKTIGIIGTGRIGRFMIKIAQGFGMKILAYDAFPNSALAAEMGFKYVSLDELLSESDIISLHTPYLPSTHHIINADNIGKIKKGALLINTARGALIETDALVKALNSGQLGGYGADVMEEEGIIQDERAFLLYGHPEEHNLKIALENHVLINMPNVIITPHTAFNTKEAIMRILDTDIENIKSFIKNGETKFPIPS